MLLKATPEGLKPMAVSRDTEMTQFHQEISGYNTPDGKLTITFRAIGNTEKEKSLTIPLSPNTEKLTVLDVELERSPTSAYKMPQEHSDWFSACFGYDVQLVYLGSNTRAVLFQDMQPLEPDPLTRMLQDMLPFTRPWINQFMGLNQAEQWRIGFTDCAPYLVVSQTSLDDVSSRLPDGEEMDMTKFRVRLLPSIHSFSHLFIIVS
jgi:hypothetical protein